MKYLVLAVLWALVQTPSPVPPKTADSPAHGSGSVKNQARAHKAPITQPPPSVQPVGPQPDQTSSQSVTKDNGKNDVRVTYLPTLSVEPDRGMWIFSGLLVIVGAVQAWLLYRTWGQIERQAGVMKDQLIAMQGQLAAMADSGKQTDQMIVHAENQAAALLSAAEIAGTQTRATTLVAEATVQAVEVAKKNADALINAERPWITATVRKTVRQIRVMEGTATAAFREVSYFDFVLKNLGRTPAQIIAIRGEPTLTTEGIDGGLKWDDEPKYGLATFRKQIKLLAPNEEWIFDNASLGMWQFPEEEQNRIKAMKLHQIYTGVVIYLDTLRPEVTHETRFCYTYFSQLDDYRPSGPPQFTSYT